MSRQPEAQSKNSIRLHYEIPAELHRRAKAEAALRGMTLKTLVIEALEDAVASRTKRQGQTKRRRNK
jgi:predicted HicB family RNase H-like nuclease